MDRVPESSSLAPDAFPEYRVRARVLARDSVNTIHHDDVARTYGYAGGLVAGATPYGYLTHPLVAVWGATGLTRGTARLSLVRPVYHDDPVSVSARLVGRSGSRAAGEVAVEVTATTGRDPAATLLAGLARGGPPPSPDPEGYGEAPLPVPRRPATAAALGALDRLGVPALVLGRAEVAGYADQVEDRLEVYGGAGAPAHPGLLLRQANRALSENVGARRVTSCIAGRRRGPPHDARVAGAPLRAARPRLRRAGPADRGRRPPAGRLGAWLRGAGPA